MFNSKHVTTTLPALTPTLDNLDFLKIAKETKLVKRVTKGFCPKGYLLGLLKAVASGDGSLRKLASNLATSVGERSLSKQALHYRVGVPAINFLKKVSTQLMNDSIKVEDSSFNRVLLQDSSQLRLPKQNCAHYRGISNQWGEKSSAKLDSITDLLTGDTIDLELSDGTKQDRVSGEDILAHIEANDLILRDMGCFSTNIFKRIEESNAYYISRLPANTNVYLDEENYPLLEDYLKTQLMSVTEVDLSAKLTDKKHPARIVAIRCSEEVTNQRRAKAKAHRKKMGNKANKLSLEREGWSIYVTNLSEEQYGASEIYQVYALRWNIEIQFRALKGQANIRALLNRVCKNKEHLEILLHAMMIYCQLTTKALASIKRNHKELKNRLSIELFANWFGKTILNVLDVVESSISYDLRHIITDKHNARKSQLETASSLF